MNDILLNFVTKSQQNIMTKSWLLTNFTASYIIAWISKNLRQKNYFKLDHVRIYARYFVKIYKMFFLEYTRPGPSERKYISVLINVMIYPEQSRFHMRHSIFWEFCCQSTTRSPQTSPTFSSFSLTLLLGTWQHPWLSIDSHSF